MDKHYDPKIIEDKWYNLWLENKTFHSDHKAGGEPYCVMIPPPNVTGILHMGHALNNTIQDILVRWRKMQGRNVVWMPGTDHAGIATQNVVERALKKEGKTREDLGREAFIERVWEWRKEYGGTIINQLKKLGCACDWERERFTMDEGLSDAVAEVFVQLYEKGLIYKGNYIVNWCSRCHTALSDEESEHAAETGKLYYLRYKIGQPSGDEDKDYVVVATTRPETLLGDVAVAVSPNDERYAHLEGKKLILPVLGRELVVIKDEFVDPEFGTGLVKVTPAHDPNDFDMGQRHKLVPINVMNGNGTMNEAAGPYEGMDRFECRKKILKDLEEADLLEKIEDHAHSVGHCYRCDTVVEPRLSPQWFVKMQPLAEPAIEAVTGGKIEFVPARWTKVYLSWLDNIRDWCISRQIWWGHRIPVFYCDACGHEWAAKGTPDKCAKCGDAKIRQDEDVLDTWFSSWLWPFSTFGWPKKDAEDLKFYYPTNDLVTASEIIFFWVARMIMSGIEFMGDIPFDKVYIHGTVRDDKGLKMSKSLGNSIDPLTIIDEFSADALRFSLMMITATGQDVYLSNDKFEIGRNFGTKLWNAARLMQMHGCFDEKCLPEDLEGVDASLLSADDKHLIAKLQDAIRDCNENLEKYRFNDAAHVLYEFTWHQYCDWYLESSKHVFFGDDEERKVIVRQIMNYVFSSVLKLLHPTMPFITEELWHAMHYVDKCSDTGNECSMKTIMNASWPVPVSRKALEEAGVDSESVEYVDRKHDMIRSARTLKADYGIAASTKVNYQLKPDTEANAALLKNDEQSLISLLRAETLLIDSGLKQEGATPGTVTGLGSVYMPIEGLIDIKAEIEKQEKELSNINNAIERTTAKLDNVNFISKAPPEVVEQQKRSKQDLIEKREKVNHLLEMLSSQ